MNTSHSSRTPGIWVLAFVLALLQGCASMGTGPEKAAAQGPDGAAPAGQAPEAAGPADSETGSTEPAHPGPYAYPAKSFDKDTLYELLVAEIAGYRGQYDTALDKYIEAAQKTRDPGVAARATRLAAYLKEDEKALQAAQIWAEEEPDNIDAHRHAADVLMRAGDLEGAVKQMEAVKRLGGLANFDVFAYRAANLDEKSRASLLATISRMLEEYPDDRQLRFSKAVLLVQSGKYQEAIDLINGLLAQKKDINAIILKVQSLKALNRTDDALEFLASAVQAMPDNRRLRLIYARYLFEAEELDKAKAQYEEVLENAPNDGDVLFALALISMEQDNDEQARQYLKEMIRWGRRAGEAHFYLGSIAEKHGDVPTAIREYKQAGQGYEFLPAQSRIAELMIEQGRLGDARAYLENLQGEYPDQRDELVQLEAKILSDRGFEDQALEVLDDALARDPDNIDLLYFRAMTGEKFGHLDILEHDLRRVLALDPDNADAMNALGYTLADKTDRHEEALKLIREALQLKPNEAAYIDSLGWVQYRLKNYDEAIEHLRKALDMFPNDEVAAHLGEVLWTVGKKEEANKVWDKALERAPDSEILKQVIRRFRDQ